VVVDEVQRMPDLFPILRSLIDRDRRPGRFLLLGSSSPGVMQGASESLAGRVAYHDLMPLSIEEVGPAQMDKLWLRGGYPEVFRSRSHPLAFARTEQYVRACLERDLPLLGLSVDPRTTGRLLSMLASVHGQPLNASMLAKSIAVTVHTVQRYLSFLEQAYLIALLPSHHVNMRKRLVKAPKAFILDSGILHTLTGIRSMDALMGSANMGHSWEGFVQQQIRARYGHRAELRYFRTQDGAELDIVLARGDKALAAIETKASNAPMISKGNRLAFEAVKAPVRLVVTPKADDYPAGDGITVCSLSTLFKHLDKALPAR
jgi:predicted AAA+ superfamily ATPase